MTRDFSEQPANSFEAYADGLLGDEEREAFEQELMRDPTFRAEWERQQQIDASLRRMFSPPAERDVRQRVAQVLADESASDIGSAGAGEIGPASRRQLAAMLSRGGRWAVAAGLLLVLGVMVYLTWRSVQPPAAPHWPEGYGQIAHGDMETVYAQAVASGFQPGWECPPPLFRATMASRLGQPLEMGAFPEDIHALGIAYTDSLSNATIALLAYVHQQPVMVFIDRAESAPDQPPTIGAGLHIYRKVIGELVLFEISPLDQPRVIEHLHAMAPPAETRSP